MNEYDNGDAEVARGRASVRPAGGYNDDDYRPPAGGYNDDYRPPAGGYNDDDYRPPADGERLDDPFDPFDPFTGGLPPGPGGYIPAPIGRVQGRATVVPTGFGPPADPRVVDGPPDSAPQRSRKAGKRRRRRILGALAALIMLTGIAIVGVAYYSSTIIPPDQIALPQATTIYYSDGKTVMAQVGQENRTIVPASEITPVVRQAVISTEDLTFYSNVGVDFKGIARAFVNNITGGQTEGASTITQQYARAIAGLNAAPSYSRKAKEIVLAIKLARSMSKDDILTNYLNTVNFGRGSYGIEAAAEAYFGTHAQALTANQAMVLAGLIKDPNGGIYDPSCGSPSRTGPKKPPCQTALDRFAYTQQQMAKVAPHPGFLPPDQVATLAYPTNWIREDTSTIDQAMASPEGFIVHHVMSELTQPVDGKQILSVSDLKNGGYQIVTTIDHAAQAAADRIAGGTDPQSPVRTLKKGIGAALVAVQPGTGDVVAYYGGSNGANIDFGGIYNDPVTTDGGWSGHNAVPGSSFKTITMATALQAGLSINSYWYGPPARPFDDRPGNPVHNAGTEACPGVEQVCTMWTGLKLSLNTMYYEIGEYQDPQNNISMSPAKVIDMAGALGVKNLWPPSDRCSGIRQALTGTNGSDLYPRCFTGEVSFGQFGVALQDMAAVMATMANHGVRVDEHFVDHVTQGQGADRSTVYTSGTTVKSVRVPDMTPQQFDDETWAMQQVFKNHDELDNQLAGGRPAAVKTGTYQLGDSPALSKVNGSAFFNGFTAGDDASGQIAASVWVGYTGKPQAVETVAGKPVGGAGTPAAIWQQFVDAYTANGPGGKPWPVQQFAGQQGTGNPDAGERPSPSPPPPSPSGSPSASPSGSTSAPPTAPGNLTVSSTTATSVSLSWTPSTDDVGVTGYDVYRGLSLVTTVTGTSYTDNGLSPGTAYLYTVYARDGDGNTSPASNSVSGTTLSGGPDVTPPTVPGALTKTASPPTAVSLSWTASTDNVGVIGYDVYRNGTLVGTATGTSYTDSTIKTGHTYTYTVKARDAAGNRSTSSNPVTVNT